MALRVHAILIQNEVEDLVITCPSRTIHAQNTVEGLVPKTIHSIPRWVKIRYSGSSRCYLTVDGTEPTTEGEGTYCALAGQVERIPIVVDGNQQCTVKVITGDHDGKVSVEAV